MTYKCAVCGKILTNENQEECSCGSQIFVKIKKEKDRSNEKINHEGRLENITMVDKGIFEINMDSIIKDLIILKDYNGVYYVRLPYSVEEQKNI